MKKPNQPSGFLPINLLVAYEAIQQPTPMTCCDSTPHIGLDIARVAARDQEYRVLELLAKTSEWLYIWFISIPIH